MTHRNWGVPQRQPIIEHTHRREIILYGIMIAGAIVATMWFGVF